VRALGLSLKRHHSLFGALNVKLADMLSCQRPEVRLTPNQRILCSDVKKCFMASSGSHLVFCTAQQQDTFKCLRPVLHICAACCSDSKMESMV